MNAQDIRKKSIFIIAQAYYGNRTGTYIKSSRIDQFIMDGSTGDEWNPRLPIDRTVVRIPGAPHIVLIYNRFMEVCKLERKRALWKDDEHKLKPTAVIPEIGLTLYSRVIACRMDEHGWLKSLEEGDGDVICKYLPL